MAALDFRQRYVSLLISMGVSINRGINGLLGSMSEPAPSFGRHPWRPVDPRRRVLFGDPHRAAQGAALFFLLLV